jgi:hypothetical protein
LLLFVNIQIHIKNNKKNYKRRPQDDNLKFSLSP